MGTWGRKPSCTCGRCPKCRKNAAAAARYRALPMDERRARRQRRDAERVRADDRRRYRERLSTEPAIVQRRRATKAVYAAIQCGRLERRPCEQCGAVEAQAHHDDYSKPLDVRWLCTPCHAAEHNPDTRAAA